jgi:murein L,D-transpeptidase YcbB/YkuD
MMFKIINLADGSQKDCSFKELSTSLVADCEILRLNESGLEAIGFVSHKTLVFFAVETAQYALQNYIKKTIPEAEICINLTKKWIKDSSSVSKDELKAAADAAAAAYAADAADAHAAANADAATYRANAADAAAYAAACAAAADTAYYAAAYTTNAAAYATDAAGKNRLIEQNRQATFILNFFGAE